MKVLIFYTYNKGLLSHFFQDISARLVDEGHEVHTFYLKHKSESFEKNGVYFWGEKRRSLIYRYLSIFKIIKKLRPDTIVSNFGYINPALICGKILGVKNNIAWFHTAFGHSKRLWLHVWFKKQCFKLAKRVIVNSKILSLDMNNYYGVPIRKLTIIPFWTPIDSIESEPVEIFADNAPRKVFKIGCPGRLVMDKNQSIVLKALKSIDSSFSWELYIAGDGPEKNFLINMAKDLGFDEKVFFLGNLNTKQMVTYYKSLDLVVLPSLHEAFGMVFLEALSMECPVLVSSSFGSLGYIDTEYGIDSIIFNPNDEASLSKLLSIYLKGLGLPRSYFKKIYQESFNEDLIFKKIKAALSL